MKTKRKWIILDYSQPDALRAEDIPYDAQKSIKEVIDSGYLGASGYSGINGSPGSIGASGYSGVGGYYTPEGLTRATVGGIPSGTDLGTSPVLVSSVLQDMLYPYLAPGASLSGGDSREMGSSDALTLSWTATRTVDAITSIIVDSDVKTPTGNTQSGSQAATSTQDVNTTFYMSVNDGTTLVGATTTVYWYSKRYWGSIVSNGVPSDADILALTGAGVGSGNELASNYVKTYNGIDGAGNYLMFAWPTSFGTTPTFVVNGLIVNSFTKIRSNSSFTNTNGYTTNYDVWISNTQQNSPITSFQIS